MVARDRGDGNGDGPADHSAQIGAVVLALAQAAFTAREQGSALPPEVAEAVAQLAGLPSPLAAVGTFLEAVASGGPVPSVPEGLPSEVAEILEKLKG